jgi:hypothetical protein
MKKSRRPKRSGSRTTAADVARWMLAQMRASGSLYQGDAAGRITEIFGDEFTYENANGNLAIGRDVLKTFRSLTENDSIWDRSERAWRPREDYDTPGKRQSD